MGKECVRTINEKYISSNIFMNTLQKILFSENVISRQNTTCPDLFILPPQKIFIFDVFKIK